MEIGATKAVQERIKSTALEATGDTSLVFCWYTHLVKLKGRNVLLIVNASNRYTSAMTDIEPRNWNYYKLYIGKVIRGIMQSMGYSQEQIQQYFTMAGEMIVTKTHGRKSVGGINRMVTCLVYCQCENRLRLLIYRHTKKKKELNEQFHENSTIKE